MTDSSVILNSLRQTLPHAGRLLLAVSGGKDSVVLLDGVSKLAKELKLTLGVAHVDHALRSESADDATFVHSLAAKYGFPFYARRLTPSEDARGIEAWAREQRYQFFTEVLQEHGYHYTLTAHHADDRAETVLMRFLANREPSSIHDVDTGRKLLRPLLAVGRSDIDTYLERLGLPFREDSSNRDLSLLRNRYRQRIIPFLEAELGSKLDKVLSDRAHSLEDDAQALEGMARSLFETLNAHTFGTRSWLNKLRQLIAQSPRAVQWRLIERVLAAAYQQYFGRRVSLLVLEFVLSGDLAVEIPGRRKIVRRDGGLNFNDVN